VAYDEGEDQEIRIRTTQEQALDFLRQMIEDDEFRQRFERETAAVLEEYGVSIPAGQIPDVVRAPEKESLQRAVEELARSEETGVDIATFWGWFPVFLTFRTFRTFRKTFRTFRTFRVESPEGPDVPE
jgi:hypothetical protein